MTALLPGLGTLKLGRKAARKGRIKEMEAIFAKHMAAPEAQDALALAMAIAHEKQAALPCFEACASGC